MTPNSGRWFPEIPQRWEVVKLGTVFKQIRKTADDGRGIVTVFRDGQVTLRSNRRSEGFTEATDYSLYQNIELGQLAIHNMDAFAGAVGVSDSTGMCSPVVTICDPSSRVNATYAAWVLREMARSGWIEANAKSVRERTSEFRWQTARSQLMPLPPRSEQDAIVAFLDRELKHIDRMMEKQLEIKKLLAERRSSYILRVISKGTRNAYPLKDSGIPWLGSIPDSWELAPIRRLSRVQRGASPRPIDDERYFDSEGKYGWVRISDVTASGMILTETEQKLSALGASLSVKMKTGDLFLSIAGSYGKAAIAGDNVCIHDGFVWFPELTKRKIHNEWLYWVFESGKLFDGIGKLGTQVNLNTSIVGAVKVAVPSFDEQVEISEHLRTFTLEEERLTATNDRYTRLLQERRVALISAAVTGTIDVRGL